MLRFIQFLLLIFNSVHIKFLVALLILIVCFYSRCIVYLYRVSIILVALYSFIAFAFILVAWFISISSFLF